MSRFLRFWFAPLPAERLALVRILVGAFAIATLGLQYRELQYADLMGAGDFRPVGPVALLPAPLASAWVVTIWLVALLLGVAFTLGFCFRFSGPLFAAALLWVWSYQSSWGIVFHTETLLFWHVVVLALSPAADCFAWSERAALPHEQREKRAAAGHYGWALRTMASVVVLSYFLAGVAKLRHSGMTWADGEVLLQYVAQMAVRDEATLVGAPPLARAWAQYPATFAPLSLVTLLCELGAFIALWGPRWALGWCAVLWGFHVAVWLTMGIVFAYPLSTIAFLPFFRPEEWRCRVSSVLRARSLAAVPARTPHSRD